MENEIKKMWERVGEERKRWKERLKEAWRSGEKYEENYISGFITFKCRNCGKVTLPTEAIMVKCYDHELIRAFIYCPHCRVIYQLPVVVPYIFL